MDSKIDTSNIKVCRVCQAPADKSCRNCNLVNYCCKEHQVQDWKLQHKNECAVVLEENDQFGRHFVAQRDLAAGQIVLDERPTLIQNGFSSVTHKAASPNICLGCSVENCPGICGKCGWPVCNDKCSKVEHHAQYECKLFQEKSVKFTGSFNSTISAAIFIIRGILMKKVNPEKWNEVHDLIKKFINKEKPLNTPQKNKFYEYQKLVLPYIKKINIGQEFTILEDIKHLAFLADFVDFTETPSPRGIMKSEAIFTKSSLLTNWCFSNCSTAYGSGPKFQKVTWTTVDVKKGEILSIAYNENVSKIGAGHMIKFYNDVNRSFFTCACPRCLDPKESGTMLSAVKCQCSGYFLPVDHNDVSMNAKWICDQACENTLNWGQVLELVEKYQTQIRNFEPSVYLDILSCETFLEELGQKFHPNHWLVIYFHEVLSKICMQFYQKVDTEIKWDYFLTRLNYLTNMFDLIFPGIHDSKLTHLNIVHFALKMKISIMDYNGSQFSDYNDQAKIDEKKRICKQLTTVLEVILKIRKIHPGYKDTAGENMVKELENDIDRLKSLGLVD